MWEKPHKNKRKRIITREREDTAMKRVKVLIVTFFSIGALFCVFCLMTSKAKAIETRAICGTCGAQLQQSGQFMGDWYTYHQFLDNNGHYATCAFYHYIERVNSYCPNGHGVMYYEDRQTDVHTNPDCPLN